MRRGDPDAFDALLGRYQNRLYRYLLRFTANRALAEDIFQDTWLKVITRIHRYDERRPARVSPSRHAEVPRATCFMPAPAPTGMGSSDGAVS